jgi:hypothetical protein
MGTRAVDVTLGARARFFRLGRGIELASLAAHLKVSTSMGAALLE